MSTDTIRPEDLYITNPNDAIWGYPLFNERSYPTQIDTMEYCLGLQRGDLNANNKSCPVPRRVPLRAEIILALQRHEWALCPDEETLRLLSKNLLDNGERPMDARRNWETIYPLQPEYTYTLFFKEDILAINSPRGPCKSGETLIQSEVHPAMTIASATRYMFDKMSREKMFKVVPPLLRCNYVLLRRVLRRSFLESNTTLGRPNVFRALDDVEAGTPEKPVLCNVEPVYDD
ncbi:hypothetical protein BDN71DRAFT_1440968 [Pleurotus eryngii]|uniref:Uncharacterized protein n=1 Tax=Pleurotus eryngii TaxID=5323 RepID=A0A9P6A6K4_PLEER|nr:hypothetical protein BDN71DRAFT_1440968 [Pleurotus eryngii]